MPSTYTYDLWDGKQTVGTYSCDSPLVGMHLVINTISELKRAYGRRYETITIPVGLLIIKDNGIEYTVRRVLDVSRKSKRQRALIK